ncbi:glycosyltransferase family 4 protein [Candidatus Parcubacteria bacterium]|nr:glycosyltransferase family 4 protein [Candidatus Parcubacteria bacterium]
MKLLILTQKVDKNDPILGFFHEWLREFAKRFESLVVICLEMGEYDLPDNVKVLSLGKEEEPSRAKYLAKFYKYIWQERANYDAVFVHMNQEYVLLGSPFWKLLHKNIYLWRNHAKGDVTTNIAVRLSNKVFYTSPKAFVADAPNAHQMPAGIDLERFASSSGRARANRILVLGRIAPVKKILEILDGFKELSNRKVTFEAHIVGDALPKDHWYQDLVQEQIEVLNLGKKVRILPAVSHEDIPAFYRQYKLLINMTPDGSLDKTIFEALASGLKVIVVNSFFREWLPVNWVVRSLNDPEELANDIKSAFSDAHGHNTETQGKISILLTKHSLSSLIKLLGDEIR